MEKSAILSRAITLAFLVVTASCVSFSTAARAPALAELESEPAPVDVIEFCRTDANCKNMKCSPAGHLAKCVYNVCSCKVAPADSPVATNDETCSTDKDCKISRCNEGFGWHMKCVNGTCKCVLTEPTPLPVVAVREGETCTTVKDCKNTKCPAEYGLNLRCINGTCKCVPDPAAVVPPGSF